MVNVRKVSQVVLVHIEGVGLGDVQQKTNLLLKGSSACDAAGRGKNEAVNHTGGNSTTDESESLDEGTGVDTGNTEKNVSSSGGLPDWLKNTLPRITHHMHHSLEIVAPSLHGGCPVEELLQMKSGENTWKPIEERESEHDLFQDMV